jgi:hypothetical protein
MGDNARYYKPRQLKSAPISDRLDNMMKHELWQYIKQERQRLAEAKKLLL